MSNGPVNFRTIFLLINFNPWMSFLFVDNCFSARCVPWKTEMWFGWWETPYSSNVIIWIIRYLLGTRNALKRPVWLTKSALQATAFAWTKLAIKSSDQVFFIPSCRFGWSTTSTHALLMPIMLAQSKNSFVRVTPRPSALPLDNEYRYVSTFFATRRSRMGLKNITSSSGWATTRRMTPCPSIFFMFPVKPSSIKVSAPIMTKVQKYEKLGFSCCLYGKLYVVSWISDDEIFCWNDERVGCSWLSSAHSSQQEAAARSRRRRHHARLMGVSPPELFTPVTCVEQIWVLKTKTTIAHISVDCIYIMKIMSNIVNQHF